LLLVERERSDDRLNCIDLISRGPHARPVGYLLGIVAIRIRTYSAGRRDRKLARDPGFVDKEAARFLVGLDPEGRALGSGFRSQGAEGGPLGDLVVGDPALGGEIVGRFAKGELVEMPHPAEDSEAARLEVGALGLRLRVGLLVVVDGRDRDPEKGGDLALRHPGVAEPDDFAAPGVSLGGGNFLATWIRCVGGILRAGGGRELFRHQGESLGASLEGELVDVVGLEGTVERPVAGDQKPVVAVHSGRALLAWMKAAIAS
jgi:hypothetical protein